jgi:hypothetical protein
VATVKVTATARYMRGFSGLAMGELEQLLVAAGARALIIEEPSPEGWFRISLELWSEKTAREIFEKDAHVAAFAAGGWIIDS